MLACEPRMKGSKPLTKAASDAVTENQSGKGLGIKSLGAILLTIQPTPGTELVQFITARAVDPATYSLFLSLTT